MDELRHLLQGSANIAGSMFFGAIAVVALWEAFVPARVTVLPVAVRWLNNIALAVFNMVLMYGTIGFVTLAAAEAAAKHGWGLLHMAGASGWVALAVGLLWVDLASYGFHRLFHQVPVLWRLHRLHHSDPELDFTSTRRHHPFEALIVAPLTALAVLAMGVSPLSLLLWWALSGVTSVLQHGNIEISRRIDQVLRRVVVTPAMHLIHHSAHQPETDSNYGQVFPWWDRIFGTYVHLPRGGYETMTVGLEEFRATRDQFLDRLLFQPFVAVRTDSPAGEPRQAT